MRGAVAAALVVFSWPLVATAADKGAERQACLDASSKGQTLRDARKLVEAREEFRACGRGACPGPVQRDCVAWLAEVEGALASLTFAAKDPTGADLVNVTVTLDEKVVATALDGRSFEVNPGPHKVRLALADGTFVEQQLLTHEGDKNRMVQVVLGKSAEPVVTEVAPAPIAPPVAASPVKGGGLGTQRVVGLVVAGAGVVGLGLGAVFGLSASSSWSSAQSECQTGNCGPGSRAQDDRSSALGAATASTVSVIAGGALLAAGGVLFFTGGKKQEEAGTTAHLRVTPALLPGRGSLLLTGAF